MPHKLPEDGSRPSWVKKRIEAEQRRIKLNTLQESVKNNTKFNNALLNRTNKRPS